MSKEYLPVEQAADLLIELIERVTKPHYPEALTTFEEVKQELERIQTNFNIETECEECDDCDDDCTCSTDCECICEKCGCCN